MSLALVSAIIEKGREHGLSDSAILDFVQAAVATAGGNERTSRQDRNARYYEKKKAERLNKTSEQDAELDAYKKEIPPVPPKEKNYTHTREATDAERYADEIRATFTKACVACPDLNPSIAWRKAGWPIEIVCETIRAKLAAAGTRRISTLNFFTGAIADAVAAANAPVPIGKVANQRAGPNGGTKATPERALREALGIGEFANVSSYDFQSPKPTCPVIEGVGYRTADRP